jgi:hypothetical protein
MRGSLTSAWATSLGLTVLLAACAKPTTTSQESLHRVRATPSWTVEVPSTFKLVDNGDSFQAYDDDQHRFVYLGSLIVSGPDGGKAPREGLAGISAEQLARLSSTDRHSVETPVVRGAAVVEARDGGYLLSGFSAQDGSVVTCIINFESASDRAWAIATWKSIAP